MTGPESPVPRPPMSILVVDDDETIRETMVEFFEALGHRARAAATATEARRALGDHAPDIALVDVRLPDADGLTLLEAIRADDPEVEVIFLTGHADVRTAVRAMRQGAVDFLEKPIDLEALEAAVERAGETARLRREVSVLRARDRIADGVPGVGAEREPGRGSDRGVDRLIQLAARNDDAPVLITGETGTGKGWVARRIHELSPRASLPFVEVNCASLSATFFESELFGHERGAFTDAKQAKRGLLEVAGGGTVFLDEVAETTTDVQPKLLKVIEEHTYRRLGGTTEMRSQARIILATHQRLEEAVAEKRFRADLYYRLQVLTIELPPLRERRDEIPALARTLLPRGARLSPAAVDALAPYAWAGNIRELKNALWRASILADGSEIGPEHLGLPPTASPGGVPTAGAAEPASLEEWERLAIARALERSGGNRTRAAELLGISRSTLAEKLKRG